MSVRLALLLLVAPSALVRANPIDAFGFGARGAAMGNAAAAVADDGSANYYNPAGLARARALSIEIGYQGARPWLSWNGRDAGVDPTNGFVAALAVPGRIGRLQIAFGLAVFVPDDRISRVRALPFAQPRFVYYDNRTQRFFLGAHLAVRIVPGLYVGAGLVFMSRTQGTVALKGQVAVSDPNEQSALLTSIDVDLVAIRYPQAGLLWEATRWLTLALTYRHSFVLTLDQAFSIRGDVGNPGAPPIVEGGALSVRIASTDLFQPWQLTAGAAARITRRLLVAFDLTFARWSEFPTPASSIDFALDIGPQLNPLVNIPPARVYPPPGFRDLLVPRLGVEWRAVERPRLAVDLRAGYSYEPTAAPEQTGETNYADADKHRVSLGGGVTGLPFPRAWPAPVSLDFHLAATVLPARRNRKSDPLDPVGDFTARGVLLEGGVTTRWRF